jgi:hypothetical protein
MFCAIITDANNNQWETERFGNIEALKECYAEPGWVNGVTGNQFFIRPEYIVSIEILKDAE